jgi:excisionase family DNA binding protein
VSMLSIGRASEYVGVSIDTLRRWEKKGKIEAHRSPGGHRYFKRRDLDELFGTKYEREPSENEPSEKENGEKQIPQKEVEVKEEVHLTERLELFDEEYAEEKILTRPTRDVSIPLTSPVMIRQSNTHIEAQSASEVDSQTPPSILIPQINTQTQTNTVEKPAQQPQPTPAVHPYKSDEKIPVDQSAYEAKKDEPLFTGSQKMILIVIFVSAIICFALLLYFLPQPEIISPVPN